MASEAHRLEIFFFPFMAPGHMIPILDMAGLFASRGGVKATVVTTPGNATLVQPAVDRANQSAGAARMRLLLIPFPCAEAGLPDGCENAVSVPPGLRMKFITLTELLRGPFEQLIERHHPDCIISDAFFPWTADVAQGFGIPRLVFDGTSFFSNCVFHSLEYLVPKLGEECPPEGNASFVVPGLPHRIEMLRTQMPDFSRTPESAEFLHALEVSELKSFGMVLNSFYELEPEYADHYKNTLRRRAWQVGPLSLCNQEGGIRGGESAIVVDDCLNWLDTKQPNSVVYVSFGSISRFTDAQLHEIALGLEASGHPFVWVVRDFGGGGGGASREQKWLPEGFLDRMEEKNTGLLIRGWAPQVLILNHGAIGAFVSHCGWNSCLEAIAAGVPLVTWPLAAEQFFNEKQVTELLGVGESVGASVWTRDAEERELVKAQELKEKVARMMGGGEAAAGMRRRARELAGKARRAIGEGGSSYADMDRLISELSLRERLKGPNVDAVQSITVASDLP